MLHLPVQPMVARPAPQVPRGPFAYEPKLDGARLIARVEGGRARLQSRQLRPLTRCFPEIVAALREQFAGDVLLDGEVVVCAPDGRLDFSALTRRIAGASRGPVEAPATYVVFDALTAGGTDLRGYPYRVRRAVLEKLLDGVPAPLALSP